MKKKRERRKSVFCPYCNQAMVCMNRFESVYELMKGLYVWYVCPHRKGETGCGHSVLFEISPKSKRLQSIACEIKFKKIQPKKKTKR